MTILKTMIAALTVVLIVLVFDETAWSQCAMCRTALENSIEGQAVAAGFRHGIIFLLMVPYAIAGSISFGLFKAFRES